VHAANREDAVPDRDTTRFVEPLRTSPTAKTSGRVVSRSKGWTSPHETVDTIGPGEAAVRGRPLIIAKTAVASRRRSVWSWLRGVRRHT
jgi:hypothetical protein